jgi:hypothetical protein
VRRKQQGFERVVIYLPPGSKKAIEKRAADLDLNATQLFRRLVRNYLNSPTTPTHSGPTGKVAA